MSKFIAPGVFLIEPSDDKDICQLCGKEAETRPYGPNGCDVCFQCGMKNEEATKRQFGKLLDS